MRLAVCSVMIFNLFTFLPPFLFSAAELRPGQFSVVFGERGGERIWRWIVFVLLSVGDTVNWDHWQKHQICGKEAVNPVLATNKAIYNRLLLLMPRPALTS